MHKNSLETTLEKFIFQSRWLLVPFFLGLIFALACYAFYFVYQISISLPEVFDYSNNAFLIFMLTLIDKVLIASLIIMVIIGGYENTVSKLNISPRERRLSWLGKMDSTSLKLKLSTSIVSISAIHLLKMFLEIEQYTDREVLWTTIIFMVFVVSATLIAWIDILETHKKSALNQINHSQSKALAQLEKAQAKKEIG